MRENLSKEACAAVRRAGIPAIEFWGWWDKDLDALQAAQTTHGLTISACCTRFIILADGGRSGGGAGGGGGLAVAEAPE